MLTPPLHLYFLRTPLQVLNTVRLEGEDKSHLSLPHDIENGKKLTYSILPRIKIIDRRSMGSEGVN